jgi:hypothetical protein
MSGTRFAFEADKSTVVGAIEELLTGDVNAGASSITVDTTRLADNGASLSIGEYVLRDNSGTGGVANSEIINVTVIGTLGATCVLTITPTVGAYAAAAGASILTPGHEMVLTSADFNCRLRGISLTPKWDEDDANSKFATGDHGEDQSIAGARTGEISFSEKIAVPNYSDLSAMPVYAKFLRGLGMEIVLYPTHGIEFMPMASADNTTMTLWFIYKENAALPRATAFCFAGCKGTGDISAAGIGKPYMIMGKFSGKYTRTTDLTNAQILVLTAPETTLPEKMLSNNVAISFSGVTATNLYISQFKLDLGNEVTGLINQGDSTGYDYFSVVTRKPRFTVDPIMKLKANDDFDSTVTNEVTGTIQVTSALASPHITINVPSAQLVSPAIAAREGYVSQNRTYRCLRNTGATLSLPVEAAWSMLFGTRS